MQMEQQYPQPPSSAGQSQGLERWIKKMSHKCLIITNTNSTRGPDTNTNLCFTFVSGCVAFLLFYQSNREESICCQCGCTLRCGYAVPCWGLTLDRHRQEFCLGREAVLCIVVHQAIFERTVDLGEMDLRTNTLRLVRAVGELHVCLI